MKRKKTYTSEEKTIILREHLENNIPISDLSEKYGVHPNAIYKWKKQLFEMAPQTLARKNRPAKKRLEKENRKLLQLEATLKQRERLIAEIVAENIELKKNVNGDL